MARTKGSINKNSQFLLKRLEDMYGEDFDPIMKAAENAKAMQDIATSAESSMLEPKDRVEMHNKTSMAWDRVAQYTQPKLKAIEVDMTVGGDKENPIEIKHGLDDELAEQLYREMCEDE